MQTKNESPEPSEERKEAATVHTDAGKKAHAHSLRSLGVAATGVIGLFFVFVLGDLLARSGIGWMRDISPNVFWFGIVFLVFCSGFAGTSYSWKRNLKIAAVLVGIAFAFQKLLGVSLPLY